MSFNPDKEYQDARVWRIQVGDAHLVVVADRLVLALVEAKVEIGNDINSASAISITLFPPEETVEVKYPDCDPRLELAEGFTSRSVSDDAFDTAVFYSATAGRWAYTLRHEGPEVISSSIPTS